MIPLLAYLAIFTIAFYAVKAITRGAAKSDYSSLKTVTFGDESAVTSSRTASVISIVTIFVLWGAFTGSALIPSFLHAPGPFVGETQFTYTAEAEDGSRDDGTVSIIVHPREAPVDLFLLHI